jgi:hypothetical protein
MIAQNNQELLLQKKRKMLLIMPILIVPALALLFSILGGGNASGTGTKENSKNISDEFPTGIVKESNENKIKIVEQNAKDELLIKQEFEKSIDNNDFDLKQLSLSTKRDTLVNAKLNAAGISNDRLREMSNAYQQNMYGNGGNTSSDISLKSTNSNEIPPPKNVNKRQAQQTNSGTSNQSSYSNNPAPRSKFNITYGNDRNTGAVSQGPSNSINNNSKKRLAFVRAVIHGDQSIKSGTLAKIHLLEDVVVDNITIPKNAIIHGQATGSGTERITISINSITLNGEIISVEWSVFDTDGNEGLHVPGYGKDKQDVRNQTVDDGANEVTNAASSVLANNRAASSGVRLATNLFRNKSSKKRMPKVDLSSGYQILIRI